MELKHKFLCYLCLLMLLWLDVRRRERLLLLNKKKGADLRAKATATKMPSVPPHTVTSYSGVAVAPAGVALLRASEVWTNEGGGPAAPPSCAWK